MLGGQGVPAPNILRMDGGQALIYGGRSNGVHGEPESGKSWLGFIATDQLLANGGRVLYLDFEDDERGVVERLQALGVPDSRICGTNFLYTRPSEPLDDARAMSRALRDFTELLNDEQMFDLVVIDSINEAMMMEDLDPSSTPDSVKFTNRVIRAITKTGAATWNVDHVTKNSETRGGWAFGSQQKKAMIRGASYSLKVLQPFGRGREGIAKLTVEKDTPGHVRRNAAADKHVATLTMSSDGDTGRIVYRLQPPQEHHSVVIDRITAFLRVNPGSPKRALRKLSNSNLVDAVLATLVADGLVRVEIVGTAHSHFLTEEA